MASPEHLLHPPHFPLRDREPDPGDAPDLVNSVPTEPLIASRDIAALLFRGAECLAAALVECTVTCGLNEARYRLLAALQRTAAGECSQSELADRLLQSESNLSTLLERMSGDGLISRTRSQADRRRSLIRMTPHGHQALAQANRARAAAAARLLRRLSPEDTQQLIEGLDQLVGELESALEVRTERDASDDRSPHLAHTPRLRTVPPQPESATYDRAS